MTALRPLILAFLFLAGWSFANAQDADKDKAKTDEKKGEKKEASVKIGDKFPAIKVDSILHPKLKSLAEVKGRLVLYEYFQHW